MERIESVLAVAIGEIDAAFKREWTKERAVTMRRNRAITARNRFFAEHAEPLGMEFKEMALEPLAE